MAGKGTPEFRDVIGRIDILTGTLGKALGGAAGEVTRRRARKSSAGCGNVRDLTCSRTVSPPVIAASTLRVLDLIEDGDELRSNLRRNTAHFRRRMNEARLHDRAGRAPDRTGECSATQRWPRNSPRNCSSAGVYVIGFSVPRRPDGQGPHPHADDGRSLALEQLDRAIEGFIAVGRELGVIPGPDARPVKLVAQLGRRLRRWSIEA